MICMVELLTNLDLYTNTYTGIDVCQYVHIPVSDVYGLYYKYQDALMASEIVTWLKRGILQIECLLVHIPNLSHIYQDK